MKQLFFLCTFIFHVLIINMLQRYFATQLQKTAPTLDSTITGRNY